jgi:Sulfatase
MRVGEMRFPSVFPTGVPRQRNSCRRYMPNVKPHETELLAVSKKKFYETDKNQSLMPSNANYVMRRSARARQAEHPAGDAILPRRAVKRRTERSERHQLLAVVLARRAENIRVGIAPCDYRQRGLDMCTAAQQMVDQATGDVRAAIPRSQFDNTVIVFTSDHRERAGSARGCRRANRAAYEESINTPLIVIDSTHRFPRALEQPRTELASNADL